MNAKEREQIIAEFEAKQAEKLRQRMSEIGRSKSAKKLKACKKNVKKAQATRRIHGMFSTREHQCWRNMRQRCRNPNHSMYKYYGARGIKVCDRWLESFDNFFQDMGPKPSPELTIERINNDGDYEPGNCKWATKSEQMRNRRHFKRRAK